MLRPMTWMALLAIASALTFSEARAQTTIFKTVQSPSTNIQANTFNAVAGLSPAEAWAVGFQNDNQLNGSRTLTVHGNGKSWHVVATTALRTNNNSAFNGVAALAANNVYAVGYQPAANGAVLTLIEQFNG